MGINAIIRYLLVLTLSFLAIQSLAQKLSLKESEITFFSEAPLENIAATNTKASGLFNTETGEMALIVPIRGFQFEISLMQEHFNEKYMDSDKFPRAIYRSRLMNFDKNAPTQVLNAEGSLIMHGVTKTYTSEGEIIKEGNVYTMNATFLVELKDHNIKIPRLMWQNIAEVVEINVKLVFGE